MFCLLACLLACLLVIIFKRVLASTTQRSPAFKRRMKTSVFLSRREMPVAAVGRRQPLEVRAAAVCPCPSERRLNCTRTHARILVPLAVVSIALSDSSASERIQRSMGICCQDGAALREGQ